MILLRTGIRIIDQWSIIIALQQTPVSHSHFMIDRSREITRPNDYEKTANIDKSDFI